MVYLNLIQKHPKAKLIEKVSNIDSKIEKISENTYLATL